MGRGGGSVLLGLVLAATGCATVGAQAPAEDAPIAVLRRPYVPSDRLPGWLRHPRFPARASRLAASRSDRRFYVVAVGKDSIYLVDAKTRNGRSAGVSGGRGAVSQLTATGWTAFQAGTTREPIVPMISGIVADGYTRVTLRGHVGHVRNNVFWLRAQFRGTIRITGPGLPTLHVRLR